MSRIMRNGVWVEISTDAASRAEAVAKRKAEEARKLARREALIEQILAVRYEMKQHLAARMHATGRELAACGF